MREKKGGVERSRVSESSNTESNTESRGRRLIDAHAYFR